jgi:hypothetical protein
MSRPLLFLLLPLLTVSSTLTLLCCTSFSVAAPIWGPEGHAMVASIATSLLNPEALAACNKILDGQSLASVASWADQIKDEPEWQWSKPLHYISTPD